MLLVKNARNLPDSVRTVLDQIARPGFCEEAAFPGLPAGGCSLPTFRLWRRPRLSPSAVTLTRSFPCCRLSSLSLGAPNCPEAYASGPA